MKLLLKLTSLLTVIAVLAIPTHLSAAETLTDWKAFSKNLVKALASPNEGLQLSAMQQIIRYSEHLNVKAAVIDVMRIYRNHRDLQVRRLALTALAKTNSNLALGFLRRAIGFEKSPVLKKQIYFILKEHDAISTLAARKSKKHDVLMTARVTEPD
jgi:HEAT repeat protein